MRVLRLDRLAQRLALSLPLTAAFALARVEAWDGVAAGSAAALVGQAVTSAMPWERRAPLVAALALGGGSLALYPAAAAWALGSLPVLVNGLLAWYFGTTLLPGREPLIARYTRFDFGRLPDECAPCARRLTLVWAVACAALAVANALPWLGASVPAGPVLALNLAVLLGLFLGEHVARSLRFPQYGVASPLRTCRAMWLATAAGAAGAAPRHAG